MADNSENSASGENTVMDYPEHERTYEMFLSGSKWVTVLSVALMIGMAFGFFAGGGFFGGLIVFIAVSALGYFLS
jgi:hypothetical protein